MHEQVQQRHYKLNSIALDEINFRVTENIDPKILRHLDPNTLAIKNELPELVCHICQGVSNNAVLHGYCGNTFCDECIQQHLKSNKNCPVPDCNTEFQRT